MLIDNIKDIDISKYAVRLQGNNDLQLLARHILSNSLLRKLICKIENINTCQHVNGKLYIGNNKEDYYNKLQIDIHNISEKYNIDYDVLYRCIYELADEFKNIKNVNIIELLKIKIFIENKVHMVYSESYNYEFPLYNDYVSYKLIEVYEYLLYLKRAKNYFGLLNE